MCRGFEQNERQRLLKITAFYFRLSVSNIQNPLPDSLTLQYLPRITGSPLEINDLQIRSDSPAFVSLHRAVSPTNGCLLFGSRDCVKVSEGVRLEVYYGEEKVLKGIFRKDEKDDWKMECQSGMESEVWVEGPVEVVMKRKRKRKKGMELELEEIPEGREEDEMDGYCCCCGGGEEMGSDGGECGGEIMEGEIEGVRWAVDVGIWVVCLGVGYLVSKASSKTLSRRRIL